MDHLDDAPRVQQSHDQGGVMTMTMTMTMTVTVTMT